MNLDWLGGWLGYIQEVCLEAILLGYDKNKSAGILLHASSRTLPFFPPWYVS